MKKSESARRGWFATPHHRDAGFTIIELVMALTLFMIIFVAIMTFMQANVVSSARANNRAKAVNVASSYIEQVRALPYTSIGTPGGDPVGVLVEQDFTQNGIDFHVEPTVTWVNDITINGPGGTATANDFKRVEVTVSASAGGEGSPLAAQTYTLESIVSRVGGQSQPTALPTVAFDNTSPATNSYLSGVVHVGAVVAANAEGATITNLNMYSDDSQRGLLVAANPLVVAQWPPLSWGATTFQWDTGSVDASGTRRYPDGQHNLTLQVFDSLGKSAFVVRSIYIVTTAPSTPQVILTASTNTTATGSWNACVSSGGVPADHYDWEIYDQNYINGSWTRDDAGQTTSATAITYRHVSNFDRIMLRVRAVGPTGLKSAWGSAFVVMRPQFTSLLYANTFSGSGAGAKWTTVISAPTINAQEWFPPHLTLTPTYYKSSVPSTATATAITLPHSFDTTKANRTDGGNGNLSNTNRPNRYYYAFSVTSTPSNNTPFVLSSWNGQPDTPQTFTPPSGAVTVWSNWVGPNGFVSGSNTSNGTMTLSGW